MSKYLVKLITSNVETMVSEYVMSNFTIQTDDIVNFILKKDWKGLIESKGKSIKNLGTIYETGNNYALLGYKKNPKNNSVELCQFEIEWELIE